MFIVKEIYQNPKDKYNFYVLDDEGSKVLYFGASKKKFKRGQKLKYDTGLKSIFDISIEEIPKPLMEQYCQNIDIDFINHFRDFETFENNTLTKKL